jgi:hypothetical protein
VVTAIIPVGPASVYVSRFAGLGKLIAESTGGGEEMVILLWHFAGSFNDAKQIESEGFHQKPERVREGEEPTSQFSLARETHWQKSHGPTLVEITLDLSEEELDAYRCLTVDGARYITFFMILDAIVNARKIDMRIHERVEDLPPVVGD